MRRRELQTEFVLRKYPPASSSPQTSTSWFYWIHVPSKNSGLVPQVLWRIFEERGDANLHSKLSLDGPWLVLHPRSSRTVRQRRLCKPIRQVGICGTRRRNLGRWSYSIPDLWLWILDAANSDHIPSPERSKTISEKGSNIHTKALFSKTSTKNSGIQCADPFDFAALAILLHTIKFLFEIASHPKS